MLVKVNIFLLHAEFVIVEMEEDGDTPIILGRPFLTIGKEIIDMDDGSLKFHVNGDEMVFDFIDACEHLD